MEVLGLDENTIRNVSPLANLTNLTELYLWDNEVGDISPLSELSELTVFWLDKNRVADISALAELDNLTELGLWENQISDIPPLLGLTNLEQFCITKNTTTCGYGYVSNYDAAADCCVATAIIYTAAIQYTLITRHFCRCQTRFLH